MIFFQEFFMKKKQQPRTKYVAKIYLITANTETLT